jgi:hypothetical protein
MGLPGATPPPPITALRPIIDTIHLAFTTVLAPDLLAAQKLSSEDSERAVLAFGNWRVRAGSLKGFTGFDTIAIGVGPMEGILLMIGPAKSGSVAMGERQVRVVIGSARCWRSYCQGKNGIGIATSTLWAMDGDAFTSLPSWEYVKVRRIDVCVDHWGYAWSIRDLERFARRGRGDGVNQKFDTTTDAEIDALLSSRKIYRGDKGSTFYLGTRGASCRLLRIYNKVVEAQSTGKLPWMEPIWRQGWDGEATVWRVEIEHGGDWLQAHGFKSVKDMIGCESELWKNYLENVRHTDGDRTRLKRCTSSQVWGTISAAVARSYAGTWVWQPRPVTEGIDCDKLITQAAGCLLSAENHLGSTPWHGTEATDDDRRGDMLAIVGRAVQRAEEKRTEEAVKHLTRLIDRGNVTGEEAQALLALMGQAMQVAAGQRLPSQAAKGQYRPTAGAQPCLQSRKQHQQQPK